MVELRDYQTRVLDQIRTGVILQGGVGSGKSLTILAYFYTHELEGSITPLSFPKKNKSLYIITTAKKRDTLEWDGECAKFSLSTNEEVSIGNIKVVVDSWNNLGKYTDVKDAFFIFDEQRLVGSGAWVKAFLTIAKSNAWVLLTATPGDVWIDYAPVFIANEFYKNRTEFIIKHVVYSRFSKYPKIDRYIHTEELIAHRDSIVVQMEYKHKINIHKEILKTAYDKNTMEKVTKKRWNIFQEKPIRNAAELCFVQRRIANEDPSRLEAFSEVYSKFKKIILFYNFNYELFAIRDYLDAHGITYGEWNGHKHDLIPTGKSWVYVVQYTAGAEGWNCIATNAMYFYSQNYSYKTQIQAEGRIDRMNTPFTDLYYFYAKSDAPIDVAITKAFNKKKNFNEKEYEVNSR